jgi:hypothetical protein
MATFNKKILVKAANFGTQALASVVAGVKYLSFAVVLVGLVASISTVKVGEWVFEHAHNIYNAAKLVDGEARGESYEGQKAAFATILTRIAHPQFPNSWHTVLFQTYTNNERLLQYNAMGDHLHEDLSTDGGQIILRRVAWWYIQEEFGIFRAPTGFEDAHSYCVRSACERQVAYFGQLNELGEIGNHVFFGDCPCGTTEVAVTHSTRQPVQRPLRSGAPVRSLRPMLRSLHLDEQFDEAIEALLVEAMVDT